MLEQLPDVLPVHPHPFKDELLSSWLIRLAHANCLKVHTFCKAYLGKNREIWNRDIDVFAPEWLIVGLSKVSGASIEEIEQTTIRSFQGIVFEKLYSKSKTPWVLPYGVYHRLRRLPGLQYCPMCLLMDEKPYFRKHWRLSFFTECDVHHTLMKDACFVCGSPVAFYRGDIGYKTEFSHHTILQCHVCSSDLSKAPAIVYPWPCWQLAVGYQSLISTYWLGWSTAPMPQVMYSHLFLKMVHQLCTLLTTTTKKARLLLSEIEAELGLCSDNNVPPSHIVFDRRCINDRHRILVVVAWMLMDWPLRLNFYIQKWGVSKSLVLKDMHPPPYFYQNALYPPSEY